MPRWNHQTLEQRFWSKVMRAGQDDCWPWTAAKVVSSHGGAVYGKFGLREDEAALLGSPRTVLAHRLAFFLEHGRWPDPCALHGCDTPLCCNAENPAHVHEGTHAQNTAEMFLRGRGRPGRLLGERANRSRLTDVQAAEIHVRYAAGGITQQGLADEYGVSQHSVSRIVRGLRFLGELGRFRWQREPQEIPRVGE